MLDKGWQVAYYVGSGWTRQGDVMTRSREKLERTRQQIIRLERVLAAMKEEEAPENYRLLSESYIDQIRRMRREIRKP